jgi:phosphoribosylglycinamide formyltransferase-1
MSAHALAILVSGTGRHLANLARLCEAGELDARIALVISDREGVGALDHARKYRIDALVLDPRRELDARAFSERAFREIEARGCDTVVMAGFLRKLDIPARWAGRVLNIHPALLPAFGGKGFWGERVHRAVLEQRCTTSGCTVHYADAEYDHGPILLQRSVPVLPADDVHSLASRVFAEELVALPEALRLHWQKQPR